MIRLIQSLTILVAFYSVAAHSITHKIYLEFEVGAGQPTHAVLTHQYCMNSAPGYVKVIGKAVFTLDTNGGVFSKCGWQHSSATYEVLDAAGQKKMGFEFYKPLSEPPTVYLDASSVKLPCTAEKVENRVYRVKCGKL